ncbi:hypothetical protein LSH36_839g05117 [Paralvinella palmiformis]|uniref:Tyrosine-protein phosphatase domain-containing protein n=1 Tax=Paralvinella palmiformis TaxID=53620 RepID=A0AAD9MTP5_9ANNE|nr:hypothetical protein LSH36_839g05117 [Paralvinella palmiformis]
MRKTEYKITSKLSPKPNTLTDFWHMVWQENSNRIVMVANVLELGKNDNVRPHRARTLVNFMEIEGFEHMELPAVSTDMNPIENMWSEVTHTMDVSANQPTNLEELRQAVIDSWQALPPQTLATMSDSMPRRVQALYDTRGGHAKY